MEYNYNRNIIEYKKNTENKIDFLEGSDFVNGCGSDKINGRG